MFTSQLSRACDHCRVTLCRNDPDNTLSNCTQKPDVSMCLWVFEQCERSIGHVLLCMCCWESLFYLWFPGSPCLAEYSDGQYYRAKLIKFTSVEPVKILVRHVDFGSDDILPPSKYELHTAGVQMYSNKRQDWTLIYTEWTTTLRLSCTKDLFSNDQVMV